MRSFFTAVVSLLMVATVLAQLGPSPQVQPPAQKNILTGSVIDSVTGEPVRKALVQLHAAQPRTTFSDTDGHFQFDDVPVGSFAVSAQKPGYFNDNELMRGGAPPVEASPNAPPAVVRLTPEAILSGVVATSSGIPLEHVEVSLTYLEIRDGRRRWDSKRSSITDEDGRFRFASLRPGSYYLSAGPYTPLAESMLDAGHSPSQGFAGVFYPGVPDLASASAIQLHPGEQTEANFALKSVPVYALSGVVSGYPAGQGVNFQVLTPAGLTVPGSYQFSAENGRFDFNSLAAGNYILRAYSQLAPDQPIRAEVPFTLSSDLHNLHLALAPSPSIPVILRTEDITSSSRSSVPVAHITPPGLAVSVCLLPVGPGANEIYASPDDPRNPQSLTLRNVESGHYSTVLQPFPPWYVASAEYGQTNLLTDDLIVSANSPAQPITIVLRNDSASLAGTVTLPDGYISPVLIVAVPERFSKASPAATYWYPARDKTPGVNEFFLDSLAPGDYLVYAFDQTQGIEFSNRDVMQPFASQATQVTLSAGQRAKVSLPLIRIQEAAQ